MANLEKYSIEELVSFKNALMSVYDCRGAKFSYAVTKNVAKIDKAIANFRKEVGVDNTNEDYVKYSRENDVLLMKHVVKNEDGSPKRDDTGNFIIKDQKKYDAELKELEEKHKKGVAYGKAMEKRINEASGKKNIEIRWHKITKVEDMSPDITSGLMAAISFMIK